MVRKKAPEGTQAVGRAIRLLKSFTRRRPEMSLSELCDLGGLTKTTTHRLLTALESEGLVVRSSATHLYRLGPTVIVLGSRAMFGNDLRTVVEPELKALASETGETATLEVLVDDRVLILSEFYGQHLVSVAAEVGTSWPIYATSTGKVLLAALPEERRSQLLEPPLEAFTPSTITDPEQLNEELERTLSRGYATAVEEIEIGAAAVAVALRDTLGHVVGAISIGGPTARLGQRRLSAIGKQLKEVCQRLSERLDPGLAR